MKVLQVENRQRDRKLDQKFFSSSLTLALEQLLGINSYEVALHLVSPTEMARVNQQFLNHEGSTDVITFDLSTGYDLDEAAVDLRGEIFISIADAIHQSETFGTCWQEETFRYALHGFLHLLGYDDLDPAKRRLMKRKENALVRQLAERCQLTKLALNG